MNVGGETVEYTVCVDEVGDPMTNRWQEEFLPDKVDAYWVKDEAGHWLLDVINVSGIGIIKRTGDVGKRRRAHWFDADTAEKMPGVLWDLVINNRPQGACPRP